MGCTASERMQQHRPGVQQIASTVDSPAALNFAIHLPGWQKDCRCNRPLVCLDLTQLLSTGGHKTCMQQSLQIIWSCGGLADGALILWLHMDICSPHTGQPS